MLRISSACPARNGWFLGAVIGLLVAACSPADSPSPSIAATTAGPTRTQATAYQATPGPTPTIVASPTPTLTPQPTSAPPTPTPVPSKSPDLGSWRIAPKQAALDGLTFADVAWTGTRFIALAQLDDGTGVFLDSIDAVNWHRQSATVQRGFAYRIAAGPRAVVAIGSSGTHLVSWSSADGLSWSRQGDAFPLPTLGTDTVGVADVTAAGDGWLAVGRRDPACYFDCGVAPKRAYVWRSADGLHWTRDADQPALNGGGMSAVSRWGDGFVAAGGSGGHTAVWTSPDGVTWSRVPDAPLFHGPTTQWGGYLPTDATDVGTVGDTIAVVGNAHAQDGCPSGVAARLCPGPRAWWSSDGQAWSTSQFAKTRNGQLDALGVVANQMLAVGWSDTCASGVWSSNDGQSWACLAGGPAPELSDVATGGNDTVQVILGDLNLAPTEDQDPIWTSYAWYRASP